MPISRCPARSPAARPSVARSASSTCCAHAIPTAGRLVVGSHGNLISLILQALEPGIGYDFHMAMPMPALYRLTHDGLRWRIMGGHGFAPVE